MHRRKVFEFWNIIAIVIFFLFVLFLIYPIGGLLREAAYVDGSLSFDAFARFFAKNYYYSTIFNSCKIAAAVMLCCLLLGIPFAYFYTFFNFYILIFSPIFLIHYIERNSKVKLDSAIALLLSTFFGLGLVLLTYLKKVPGAKKAGLNRFIFGQASTLIAKDIYLIIIVGLVLISLVILFWKEIKISIFQADYAKTLGIQSNKINFLVSTMIVVNVIIGIQIAGVILMTAMLVLPSVAARQWSKKLSVVTVLAAIIGGISGAMGSIISTLDASLPTGPLIILVSGIFVLISFLFSKKGIIARNYRIYTRNRKLRLQENKGDNI